MKILSHFSFNPMHVVGGTFKPSAPVDPHQARIAPLPSKDITKGG
ncbi:hypothetical protein [Pseudoalteromonas umbrosa]|nr:hypothetical protein [Pseudoalteromonas sp. B95]MDK1289830.1 hypothetical protein [Pseudoalteromonas sp. B95]